MRTVITGAGVVSPLGCSVEEMIDALTSNRIGIGPAPWLRPGEDRVSHYAPVRGFDPARWLTPTVEKGTDLFAQFALAATMQAVEAAGLTELDARRTAVVHGTSMGGMRSLMLAQFEAEQHGIEAIDRKTMIKIWPNMASAQIAMHWELHGTQLTICTACASSLDALGTAQALIGSGQADVALVGATEGGLTRADGTADAEFVPASFHCQAFYGMTTVEPDPARASLPFDVARSGIVTGEGSAALIVESADHAQARGAEILAELVGYASLADGYHPSSPDPTGTWEAEAMSQAIDRAGLTPDEVDVLFAHATATPKGDEAEILAINAVHGERENPIPVTALKGHLGHTGAASGAMSVIAAIHTLRTGIFPNVAGTTDVDPAVRFRVVTGQPLEVSAGVAQINSFGFGGQDASIILRRWDG
jgi:3-oxoacyl-[acyl-carrier-protein] synthase II